MMAQNTPEDKEISDFDSHETKKSSKCAKLISVGASNDRLLSYLHCRFEEENLLEAPPINSAPESFVEFLKRRGEVYEEALKIARPLSETRSEAKRKVDVKRIEDLLVWKMVVADVNRCPKGMPACGRIECWAARQRLVNIVVALIRADDPKSLDKGLLALAIAVENNDLKMVEALKDIVVADESIKSSEPDLRSPHKDLFYSDCNQPLYALCPHHEIWLCPIEAAARLGHVEMVTKLINLREAEMEAKIEAEMMASREKEASMKKELGEAKMDTSQEEIKKELREAKMRDEKSKWRRAFDWAVRMGRHGVVKLLINRDYIVNLNEPSIVLRLLDKADEKAYGFHQTPLALAVISGHFEVVKALCEATKGGLRTDAKPEKGKSAIQIAFEEIRYNPSANNPKTIYEIWKYITERADSRTVLNRLTEERKIHVDAVNAILVGTALIATATFAGWLSPPLGYSSPPGTDGPFASVEGHPILESFWVFNSLSFFFSIATFMVGANVALPPKEHDYIGDVVHSLRWKLRLAYCLVSAAVFFVIGAFASAGFAVLPPIPKYTVNMALTVGIGVTVVAVVVFTTFFGHMFTKSGWQQLKDKMKFRRWQQSKHEIESSDDD
jgi:ankyrin repeat protein